MKKITLLTIRCFFIFFACFSGKLYSQYCTPVFNNPSELYISRVQLNTLDNSQTFVSTTNSYSNLTGVAPTNLVVGQTYALTIYTVKAQAFYRPGYSVWIDYNNDNDFDDANEQVALVSDNVSSPRTVNITIPSNATTGNKRLRINMVNYYVPSSPCPNDTGNFGETEDYTINLSAPLTPIAGNDFLSVIKNSGSGFSNQINVAVNDNIGTSFGSDGNDYSTTPTTLITANGGTVTELSDGIFQYIPATNFIGTDSFIYSFCDAGNQCVTATVTVNVNLGACTPTNNSTNSGNTRYITNVTLTGQSANINNNSGDNNGYANFTNLPAADLYIGNAYPLKISIGSNITLNSGNHRSGWAAYIDFNQDGNFDTATEKVYETNGTGGEETTYPFLTRNITIPANALTGNTIMRVGSRLYYSSGNPCGNTNNQPEEFEDYKVSIGINPASIQDIKVIGNTIPIVKNSILTSSTNNTDFSLVDISAPLVTKQFTIKNNGGQNLQLGLIPVSFVLGSSATFSIVSQPPANTIIPSGGSATFTIGFDPTAIASYIATVNINSNDPDDNPFRFRITGEGTSFYPDTDGDGITNNFDIDDDNDGIRDNDEQLACLTNGFSSQVEVVFLNEDFGSGTNRARINGVNAGVTTTYCYEDGTTAKAPDECDNIVDLDDGKYTVHYSVSDRNGTSNVSPTGQDLAYWADDTWYSGEDHTPGDIDGRMAIFNASYTPGVFYEYEIRGSIANAPIDASFAILNIDRVSGRILPELTVKFLTLDRSTVLYTFDTGPITRCQGTDPSENCPESLWREITGTLTFPVSDFVIQLINKAPGGLGNDLAIDDIKVSQKLCDTDGDGVADILDLDNDNDGIPNIREIIIANYDLDQDATTLGTGWIDVNGNGMHDFFETHTPLDSDGDGVPNYLDLDSDNDGIFDAIENDGLGDIDINGDGLGDGNDANIKGVNNDDVDGDGIQSIIDTNDDDADGNDFGTSSYTNPLDTDGDGTPDYLDNFNDITGQFDIATTIYASYDTNNDGIIDGSGDTDNDGILDAFDTNDTQFGSPRDLNDKFTLYFDGRNDYVEEEGKDIVLGLNQATLMGWIKMDNTMSGTGVIVGQENFYLRITNTKRFSAVINGSAIDLTGSSNNLPTNKWVHVAAVFDGINSELKLYVNGELKTTTSAPSNINTTVNKLFRIGSLPTVANGDYFKGQLDEIRVFNEALSEDQVQKMVYQELKDGDYKQGAIIPLDIPLLNATSLIRYFKMDKYNDDVLDNITDAKLYNIKDIYFQTAPLPYETKANGNWTDVNTWKYGQYWDIDENTRPWSIVHLKNNVEITANKENLGLIVDSGTRLNSNGDLELKNNWYLKLDGTIDLQNESQLIQTLGSTLDENSIGKLERDQQGTADNFTYNYYSSPVTPTGASVNNGTYSIAGVLKDGTDPLLPVSINFQSSLYGADGPVTTPKTLSTYWMYKFTNLPGLYANWILIRDTGSLNAGEGYTMKGPNSGEITQEQNYVFVGKPNNGAINLPITAGSIYLVGNPYPSALNARQFILDNPDITGTLKFWEHWGGGSHVLREYRGGYALLNLSGSVVNASYEASDPLVSGLGTPMKTPQPSIPVAQGFFVEATQDGAINFNNGQREFVTEASGNSVFIRSASNRETETTAYIDNRMKIRLGYKSPGGIHRQLLVTVDENTTFGYDNRYDGKNKETQFDDLNWKIGQDKYIIQGVPSIDANVALPLEVKTREAGIAKFSIEGLENVPTDKEIYLKDNQLGIIHDLRASNYSSSVATGTFDDRFELVFQNATLSNDDFQFVGVSFFFNNENQVLQINNSDHKLISNVKLFNVIGQEVFQKTLNSTDATIQIPMNLAKGVYVVNLKSDDNILTKKIIIQ